MYYTSKEVYEHISKETNDPIVERKTCKISGAEFPIYKSDMEFYDKISPIFNGVKYQIPTPTLCPEERQRKRLMFRNERKLYKRKCDASGKDIVSIYSPEKPYKIYDQKFWWSDAWDPMDYGREFDFSKLFRQQFDLFIKDVPQLAIINRDSENSEYTNICAYNKNCYMLVESSNNEDCYYGYRLQRTKDTLDCAFLENGELSYETIDSSGSNKLFFSQNCENCSDCYFLINCKNCHHCVGCINLVNQNYCAYNKPVSKEEFEVLIKNLSKIQIEFSQNHTYSVSKSNRSINYENSFGNYISDTKNGIFCYEAHDTENCKYSAHVWFNTNNCCDVDTVGYDSSFVYESINTALNSTNNKFCNRCWTTSDCFYCNNCDNSQSLFACLGLRNKQYCIFNKQYTKEEYNQLVPKIIEHMQKTGERGEFFDPSLSPFGYNETVAQEYFPLTRQEALDRGYKRQDNNYDPVIPEGANVVKSDQVESLKSDEEILKSIFICEISGRPFRIIKQELEFYRKHNLPLPRKHPDVRHEERMKLRPKRELHLRNCDKCGIEIVSVYSKNFEGNVYCESCYNKEIY